LAANKTLPTLSLKIFLLTFLFGIGYSTIHAQDPGDFDNTFGEDGKMIFPIGFANAFGRALALQPDGKIVIASIAQEDSADNDFVLVRLHPDGQPDAGFGDEGMVFTDLGSLSDIPEAIAIDKSNRIIVAGSIDNGNGFDFAVARYLPDGSLDASFDEDGWTRISTGLTGFTKDVIVQDDDRIVLGGYTFNPLSLTNEFTLVRFDVNGTPDPNFDEDGIVMTNLGIGAGIANAMAIQPDGKIVLAGQVFNESTFQWEIGVVRYNIDGTLDESWDHDGISFTATTGVNHTVNAIAIQPDNKIVVGGFSGTAPSNNLFTVARYNMNGSLDDSFGDNGIMINSYGAQNNQITAIAIQPDGRILIAGTSLSGNSDRFALARLETNGEFDNTFGNQGVVINVLDQNDGIEAMALQPDGRLVVAGESFDGTRFNVVAARYLTGLSTSINEPDNSNLKATVYPNPATEQVTLSYIIKQSAPVGITLHDIVGHVIQVYSTRKMRNPGMHAENLQIPAITPGIYWIKLIAGKEVTSIQLVKK
jgi:uncharacterized delta-60 repeat protein